MDEDRIGPFFKDRHILLTGGKTCILKLNILILTNALFGFVSGTGFMGKVFIEKLLRVTEVRRNNKLTEYFQKPKRN